MGSCFCSCRALRAKRGVRNERVDGKAWMTCIYHGKDNEWWHAWGRYARNEPGTTKAGRQEKEKVVGKRENLMFASLQKRGEDAMQDARRKCTRPQGETNPRTKTTHGPGFPLLDSALQSPPCSQTRAVICRRRMETLGTSGRGQRISRPADTRCSRSLICTPRNPSHARRINPREPPRKRFPSAPLPLAPVLHTQTYLRGHLFNVPSFRATRRITPSPPRSSSPPLSAQGRTAGGFPPRRESTGDIVVGWRD